MSDRHDKHPERAHALMMAALDDELSSVEHAELDRLLAADDSLREVWNRLRTVKEVTGTMTYREPPEEVWETYWVSVYNQAERGIAWLLVSVGSILVLAWAGWGLVHSILEDSQLPAWIKLALFATILGGAILFVSVVREKWFTRRNDRYKGVQR